MKEAVTRLQTAISASASGTTIDSTTQSLVDGFQKLNTEGQGNIEATREKVHTDTDKLK